MTQYQRLRSIRRVVWNNSLLSNEVNLDAYRHAGLLISPSLAAETIGIQVWTPSTETFEPLLLSDGSGQWTVVPAAGWLPLPDFIAPHLTRFKFESVGGAVPITDNTALIALT